MTQTHLLKLQDGSKEIRTSVSPSSSSAISLCLDSDEDVPAPPALRSVAVHTEESLRVLEAFVLGHPGFPVLLRRPIGALEVRE